MCSSCGKPMQNRRTNRLQHGKCMACRSRDAKPKRIRSRGFCAHCAHWYEASGNGIRYCSLLCANRGKPYPEPQPTKRALGKAQRDARRRAWLKVAYVEDTDRDVLAERDDWTCGLCGDLVPRDAAYPHPLSASIDHVVPLSRGGEHSYENVQLAHFWCNSAKSDRGWGVAS